MDGEHAGSVIYDLFHHLLNRLDDLEVRVDVHNHEAK